jgi:hypothetical protein
VQPCIFKSPLRIWDIARRSEVDYDNAMQVDSGHAQPNSAFTYKDVDLWEVFRENEESISEGEMTKPRPNHEQSLQ